MPDLLCFSSTDWDGVWGSRQQVMLRLAENGYRVLYIERPVGPEHLLRYPTFRNNKIRRWREGLQLVDKKVWIGSLPLLIPGRYYSHTITRLNQFLQIRWVAGYLRLIQFQPQILWLYKPEFAGLVGRFGERISVYHCIDEFTAGTRGRKKRIIKELELELIKKVDLVFANSSLTYKDKRAWNPNTYQIKSAADIQHFQKAMDIDLPCHPAIAGLPRPIAGFFGNLTDRIDVDLLSRVALRMPSWHFVFIGKIYKPVAKHRALRNLPNVTFLGHRCFQQLPSLARCVDVFLLPYVLDERAKFRSPLKLYEYLATGRPIVSTPHPEVSELGGIIHIGCSPDEFVAQIQNAREDTDAGRASRLEIVQQHSWDQRVQSMLKIIHKIMAEREKTSS
jgi:glycosyltransferase involved in cell wall biosynthesis